MYEHIIDNNKSYSHIYIEWREYLPNTNTGTQTRLCSSCAVLYIDVSDLCLCINDGFITI